jgi:hypothetical protein
MDGLGDLAFSDFEANAQFKDYPHEVDFTEVKIRNGESEISSRQISRTEVVTSMTRRTSTVDGSTPLPELKLVEILIGDPFPFYIDRGLFLTLFKAISIDSYILHLILHNSYGFYKFPGRPRPNSCSAIRSYFVSTLRYTIAWSFNPENKETMAILMPRTVSTGPRNVGNYFASFLSVFGWN